jgi:serine/threonine-protein kinase OSR1/STK39
MRKRAAATLESHQKQHAAALAAINTNKQPQDDIIKEAQTMKSYSHPNVLPLLASFVAGHDLFMVTPFMAGGSVLHIMRYAYPGGLPETAIATVAREVLKGLDYVHRNGGIHRDVKAGNILIDADGSVRIGDFGVAATAERGGSWGNDRVARTTFVGTPCWVRSVCMSLPLPWGLIQGVAVCAQKKSLR